MHPGLWTDEVFVSVSMAARLFLIGLWGECDDAGIFPWSPIKLKMRLAPADTIDAAQIMEELEASHLITSYTMGANKLGAVRNFAKYQRPKKPVYGFELTDSIREFVGLEHRVEDADTDLRRRKYEEARGACAYCASPISHYAKRVDSLELDHDIPVSRGGSDDDSNLVASCRPCNRSKGAMTGSEFREFRLSQMRKSISHHKVEQFAPFAPQMEEEGVEERKKERPPSGGPKKFERGSRLPPDFVPAPLTEPALADAKRLGGKQYERELVRFRDHWLASGSPTAVKRDWNAAWRTWLSKAIEYAQPPPMKSLSARDTAPAL